MNTHGVALGGDRLSSRLSEQPMYAHPMGWRNAVLFGAAYGTVVGGLIYLIWRAITLAPVGWFGTAIAVYLWAMCFSVPLLIEKIELDNIREGRAIDFRVVEQQRQTATAQAVAPKCPAAEPATEEETK